MRKKCVDHWVVLVPVVVDRLDPIAPRVSPMSDRDLGRKSRVVDPSVVGASVVMDTEG